MHYFKLYCGNKYISDIGLGSYSVISMDFDANMICAILMTKLLS